MQSSVTGATTLVQFVLRVRNYEIEMLEEGDAEMRGEYRLLSGILAGVVRAWSLVPS